MGEKYDIPMENLDEKISEITNKIKETKEMVLVIKEELKKYLTGINLIEDSDGSALEVYKWFIIKEKSLYVALNKLKSGDKLLVGLFWLPNSQIEVMNQTIGAIREDRNISGPQIWKRENHHISPPTYFRLNEFTFPFQEITNTYGVPNYKEVNPSLFGIVTFPFLFGVMFGDMGHGFMLFMVGVILCLFDERLKESAVAGLVGARYMIVMMGIFSMFNGLCYNDFMAIPLDLGSCYNLLKQSEKYVVTLTDDCIYPIGIDPMWFLSTNTLTFMNGFKMKMAVIFGVAQMSLGITMKAFNSLYFGRIVEFFFEFIPQIVLLWSLFGFMNLLIVVKWLTNWEGRTERAPGIISIMISMFLNQGAPNEDEDPLLWDEDRQQMISIIVLLVALVTVPLMLLVKPLYMKCTMGNNHRKLSMVKNYKRLNTEEEKEASNVSAESLNSIEPTFIKENEPLDIDEIIRQEGGEENHVFSEIFIHQLIETIEFVLGTVSNTASYLRLWALSLAHSQLADVFFDKLINGMGLENNSFIMLFVLFPAFFSFTFFVLM